jgi:hypothetical protein
MADKSDQSGQKAAARRKQNAIQREVHDRRGNVERAVGQNPRRLEREVRAVRRDLEKQSGTPAARVEKLVAGAADRASAP